MSPSKPKASRHIAVVIDLEFALPWHQDCYQGIMRYGEEQGWRCSLDLHAAGIGGDLSQNPYDGVVGRIPVEVAKRVSDLKLPMVNLTYHVESNRPDELSDLPGVYVDREPSIRMAAKHLAQSGYPRLGAMAPAASDAPPFFKFASEASADLGMQWVEPFEFPTDFYSDLESYAAMLRSLSQWLAQVEKPVGLLVNRPTHSRLVAHACIEQGLRIPEDVGIVTTAGDRVMLLSSSPTITGVEFDFFRQGYRAAAMLDQLMKGEPADSLQEWIQPAELVARDSTDVFLCEDPLVSKAMRYIAEHVHGELSVDDLAEALEVSRWTLHRRFVTVLGRTTHQEINRLRLLYLKRLLRETQDPLSEISYRCGFSTPSHFTRFFKREAGRTPGAYRKLNSQS